MKENASNKSTKLTVGWKKKLYVTFFKICQFVDISKIYLFTCTIYVYALFVLILVFLFISLFMFDVYFLYVNLVPIFFKMIQFYHNTCNSICILSKHWGELFYLFSYLHLHLYIYIYIFNYINYIFIQNCERKRAK